MKNFSSHMRIASVTVGDDDVDSRISATRSLATKWKKDTDVSSIVSKSADIAQALGGDGKPSHTLGTEIQTAIQKKSSSYLFEERPLDVSVCAGMAIISILDGNRGAGGWLTADVYATALWSALSYQPALSDQRRESLRCEALVAAETWAKLAAEKSRERANVPEPSLLKISFDSTNQAATCNFQEVMSPTVEALRSNAALDREELDFLWWAQLGRSRLLNKQLSIIPEPTRILAAAIEGAKMLRRLPCEVHREIVLRTLEQDSELDLAEIISAIGDDREALCETSFERHVVAHPTVFPLLRALTTGEAEGAGAAVKRRVSEWGARALLEAGFARMMAHGASKL